MAYYSTVYCMSNKYWPFLYKNSIYRNRQVFFSSHLCLYVPLLSLSRFADCVAYIDRFSLFCLLICLSVFCLSICLFLYLFSYLPNALRPWIVCPCSSINKKKIVYTNLIFDGVLTIMFIFSVQYVFRLKT